ncbi:MAG TPA: xanthine dehydrogenase family protein molybdopterin-binding subunit [Burkholderiales bacterium]|nr:xanthine dehydrogenase family protein molybdopterin-binding subunit [Burkholderiales bacterium]
MKSEIGQWRERLEDPALLKGEGRYTDDLNEPRQAYAWMVRSQHAHGVIKNIAIESARSMPGVLAIYTGKDLAAYGTHKSFIQLPNLKNPARRSLSTDKVRFVGDPIACVVAETALQARDAAEAVEVDIEPLPAVTTAAEALAPGAPQLYDDVPGNVACDFHHGDREKVAAAFASASHTVKLDLKATRMVAAPIEPRAAIAKYEAASGRFTLIAPGQGVFGMRNQLADILGIAQDKVHMLTPHVGGSFGMKGSIYPEYVCLAHAARALGRPVKWTNDRSGSFLADQQGRDQRFRAELALDKDGHFLALRLTGTGNVGAYLGTTAPQMPTNNQVKNSISVYRTPLQEVSTKLVFTSTTPVSAYRGAGRPEANYWMERLVDEAAAQMGIDRLELRRRNHVRPEEMPWSAPSGQVYDSGEFTEVLRRALEEADVKNFPSRKEQSKKNGKLRGLGIGSYLEATSPPNKESGGIRFEKDGSLTLFTGTLDFGQGHATAFAQVVATRLAIPMEKMRLVQGDSDQLAFGAGTGGSRSLLMSGGAFSQAADQVIAKGRVVASHELEVSEKDVEFVDGRFVVAGTDRSIGLLELARKKDLSVSHVTEVIQSAFPNGCHVAEVEIDPETGKVEVARYAAVNDFGTIVNPMLVEGQIHGGVVQGIGQALMEDTRHDAEGQLLTGSFMDYAMPRASDSPAMTVASHEVPAKTNPLGVKGCGEAGCAGALTSVMNAIVDALSALGIREFDMPATPERVWRAIKEAEARRGGPSR